MNLILEEVLRAYGLPWDLWLDKEHPARTDQYEVGAQVHRCQELHSSARSPTRQFGI